MVTFKICVAEITIQINALYLSTKNFCKEFLTDAPAAFSVVLTKEDIEQERKKSAAADIKAGRPIAKFSDEYLERLVVYRKIAEQLPNYNVFLFHGSAVAVDGQAYIFTAKSGTGKSTHVRLWRNFFNERAVMVNDDKPLIKITEKGAFVCGTPWRGKHNLGGNIVVPIKAICEIKRGEDNVINEISPSDIFATLLQQSYSPANTNTSKQVISLIVELTKLVKFFTLKCNLDPNAALVAYNGMNGKESSL